MTVLSENKYLFDETIELLIEAKSNTRKVVEFINENKETLPELLSFMDDLHRWVFIGSIKSIDKKLGETIKMFVDAKYGTGKEKSDEQ